MRSKPELPKQSGDVGAGATALTQRERQIVRLVCEGLSNKEVGQRLNITDGTIKVHLHKIFEKLRVSNRTALVAVYLSSSDKQGPQDEAGEQLDHE
jgi:two-component system nitrate/nitrite response regulator NarL